MKRIRIAIADDFELWRRAVRGLLAQHADFEIVSESSDGVDAVEQTKALQPDIILMDIQMPKMDGLEAARQISKISPNTKVLFLSSNACLEIVQECSKIGSGIVVKRNAAIELIPMVRSIILDYALDS